MNTHIQRFLSSTIAVMFLLAGCQHVQSSEGAEAPNGPQFRPPFEVTQAKRQDAVLATKTFLDSRNGNKPVEAASLVVGNKRIAVREFAQKKMTTQKDSCITIFVNEKPVFEFIFAGSYRDSNNKWISYIQSYKLKDVSLKTSQSRGAIKWLNSSSKKVEFCYELKSLGDSKVELSWSRKPVVGNQAPEEIGTILYLTVPGEVVPDRVLVNGKAPAYKDIEELKQNEGKKLAVWDGELKTLAYNPQKPVESFTITSDAGLKGRANEIYHYRRVDFGFQLTNGKPDGKLIIDLGKVAPKRNDTPPPVEGNDLWAQDALHMPLSPTRNLFPNPSFEQGLRYWRWWSGGALYTRSDVPRYQLDPANARFGKNALVINPTQTQSASLRSFSLAGRKGKPYTVSFYAKAEKPGASIKLAPYSSKQGGQFGRSYTNSFKSNKLTSSWQRFSHTFVSDGAPVALVMGVNNASGKVWLDGIQYERGDKPTEFVCAPMEGRLSTSQADNNVEYGTAIDAEFAVSGKEGTVGKADFVLMDFFKKTLWEKSFDVKAGERIKLPFDSLNLASGAYIIRVRYTVPGTDPYYDFYRFTYINSIKGSFASKDLYGALFNIRSNRVEDRLDLMQRLGFGGSTSYGEGKVRNPMKYELREKYNITDYTHTLSVLPHLTSEQWRDRHPDLKFFMGINTRIWRRPEERKQIKELEYYPDDVLKRVEQLAEKCARENPYVRVWSIGTEEEITFLPLKKRRDFNEFAKLQMAFYKGIKKGNPKAIVLPSGGTSGYGKTRGKDDIEGYLKATQGKIKWDAVAIHPYGSIDGTLGAGDLDESIQMLSDSMAQYGYGEETPIYLNEGGGGSAARWGDGPAYTYSGGQPSYDQGLLEFLHACKMARQYIICLKYWPRLPHFNSWQNDSRTIVDYNLTPSSFLLGINTMAHLLAKPEFVADIRPASGMRGYAFKDPKGRGVAAVWCTINDVERGFIRGPVMRVKFDGELRELIDLMGKKYKLKPGKDGWVELQLTPAPLFLRGEDPDKLASALNKAEVVGAGANVKISFKPQLNGELEANIANLTGRTQTGKLVIDNKKIDFNVEGKKTEKVLLPFKSTPEFGRMFRWNSNYLLEQPRSTPLSQSWNMDYFYVPKLKGTLDWAKIPGIEIKNLYRPVKTMKQTPGGHKGDIKATFKAAWDDNNFYLRVEAEDDIFNLEQEKFWGSQEAMRKQLYMLDGCLEVYFDCNANGRLQKGGYDLDDYRYDFCVGNRQGKSGPGKVYRLREVFIEYAGGVSFPTKEEAAKGIKCEFTRISANKYSYTITFAQKYIAPFRLEKGRTAGFGLYLHDRMDDGTMGCKGLSLATEDGSHCDFKPQVWPLMILGE